MNAPLHECALVYYARQADLIVPKLELHGVPRTVRPRTMQERKSRKPRLEFSDGIIHITPS